MLVYCDAMYCKWNKEGKCSGPVHPAGHTALYIKETVMAGPICDDYKEEEDSE
jgi:hypothetical protein